MAVPERAFENAWKVYLRPTAIILIIVWAILSVFFKEIADGAGLCELIKMITV